MIRGKRCAAAGALMALALVTSCSSKPKVTSPIVGATTAPGTVTITIKGALAIGYSGNALLQIIITDAPSLAQNLRFTSVATPTPISSGGKQFKVGFNLVGTTGDGTFQIPPRPGSPSPGVIPSSAYVQVTSSPARTFDRPATDCTVELHNHSRNGSLLCSSLQDAKGAAISLQMTWTS